MVSCLTSGYCHRSLRNCLCIHTCMWRRPLQNTRFLRFDCSAYSVLKHSVVKVVAEAGWWVNVGVEIPICGTCRCSYSQHIGGDALSGSWRNHAFHQSAAHLFGMPRASGRRRDHCLPALQLQGPVPYPMPQNALHSLCAPTVCSLASASLLSPGACTQVLLRSSKRSTC